MGDKNNEVKVPGPIAPKNPDIVPVSFSDVVSSPKKLRSIQQVVRTGIAESVNVEPREGETKGQAAVREINARVANLLSPSSKEVKKEE
jgi:hypothetical protein